MGAALAMKPLVRVAVLPNARWVLDDVLELFASRKRRRLQRRS
jgi:hypothetical protein